MATIQTRQTSTSITYSKLRDGSWGVRGTGLTAGARVTVTKRDGSTKTETVSRILWEGNGVQLATIGASARTASPRYSSRPRLEDGYYYNRHGEVLASGCSACRRAGHMCASCEHDYQ